MTLLPRVSRRTVACTALAAAAGSHATAVAKTQFEPPQVAPDFQITRQQIHQSVMGWCFNPMPTSDLIGHCISIGLTGIEGIDR